MTLEVDRHFYESRPTDFRQETLVPPAPPLLAGIGRVIVATENERKLQAVRDLFDRYPVVRGTEVLQPHPHKLTGKEPPWENAVLVSSDKVRNVVAQLKGKPGPKTLVIGSDIVLRLNGQPYQNLSRLEPLTNDVLYEELADLQSKFSNEVEAVWDIATSVSTCQLQATLADRHVAHFRPIPADAIYWAWEKDKDGFKKRSSRVQLLDDFQDYVVDIGFIPFNHIADRNGEFFTGQEWMQAIPVAEEEKGKYVEAVLAQVVGGLPINGRLNDLLTVTPSSKSNGRWMLI